METTKKSNSKSMILIIMCFLVYAAAYLGRYSYNSNINEIIDFFKLDHASAGLPPTFFFFAYGVGQVLNGILCKRYNPKYIIPFSLMVSVLVNLAFTRIPASNFSIIKYLWLLNGIVQSMLWPTLIYTLNKNIEKEYKSKAVAIMSVPAGVGLLTIYGISALSSHFRVFKFSFYAASLSMLAIALVWFIAFDKLKKDAQSQDEINADTAILKRDKVKQRKTTANVFSEVYLLLAFLALFAVINNLIKDGMTTWMPTILKDVYGLSNSISVLLTVLLPVLAIIGNYLSVSLNKKIKDYIVLSGLLYFVSAAIMAIIIVFLSLNSWLITFIGFLLISCAMYGINNIITSIFPLCYGKNINAGLVAGVLNGFCYVGSTISSFGLGSIVDRLGWNAVMYLFSGLTVLPVLICIIYIVIKKFNKKERFM